MDKNASMLHSKLFSLEIIHKGAATLQHAIKEKGDGDREWKEYFPNHFIYAYFAFNTLYNYDWENSYKSGDLKLIPKRRLYDENKRPYYKEEEEKTKQEMYLRFCFQDKAFVQLYKDFFIKFVVGDSTKEDIQSILTGIRIDDIPKGSVRTREYIRAFQISIDDLLFRGQFDRGTITKILGFIYSVRCNIFHGVKSISDMKNYEQQYRLDIYASIIVALNQMVFSYLDYLNNGKSIRDGFERLYTELY